MQARSCFGNRFKSFFTSIWVMRSQLSSERKPEDVDVSRMIDLPWQYWHRALDASIKIGCNPWPIMDVYLALYLAKVAHLYIACSNYSLIGLRFKGCRFSQCAWVVWLVWMCSWWSEKATTFPIQTTRKSLFLHKQVKLKSQSLRPAEHARKELSKYLARQRAAKFGEKYSPGAALTNYQTSLVIFCLSMQIPHRLRLFWESGWARFIDHPIRLHGLLTWILPRHFTQLFPQVCGGF